MEKIYDVEFCNEIENSFMDNGIVVDVEHITQYDVKERIRYLTEDFCMLTTESTEDSCFDVEPNESKFLNDDNYRDDWFCVSYGDFLAFICVKIDECENLLISALEVGSRFRGQGFGKNIVEAVESYAFMNKIEKVYVHAFDSNAEKFWENMGYEYGPDGKMYKNIR